MLRRLPLWLWLSSLPVAIGLLCGAASPPPPPAAVAEPACAAAIATTAPTIQAYGVAEFRGAESHRPYWGLYHSTPTSEAPDQHGAVWIRLSEPAQAGRQLHLTFHGIRAPGIERPEPYEVDITQLDARHQPLNEQTMAAYHAEHPHNGGEWFRYLETTSGVTLGEIHHIRLVPGTVLVELRAHGPKGKQRQLLGYVSGIALEEGVQGH